MAKRRVLVALLFAFAGRRMQWQGRSFREKTSSLAASDALARDPFRLVVSRAPEIIFPGTPKHLSA